MVRSPAFVNVGKGFTSINKVSTDEHPFALVPVRKYCCEEDGDAIGLGINGLLRLVEGVQE